MLLYGFCLWLPDAVWLPQTDFTVESASSVMLSSPLSPNHLAFLDSKNICSFRAPLCPRFFNVEDMTFSFIALSSLNNAVTKPSPLNAAILHIRLIPLIEASVIAINTRLTPNFVALCHSVGNDELMDLAMYCRFIYFTTVLRPEYFVMLLPGNVVMNECRTKLA